MKNKIDKWNYRVLAVDMLEEIEFRICRVWYKDDKPIYYSDISHTPFGTSIDDLKNEFNLMQKALNKTILCYAEKFPQEYKLF